jgi:N-formylglutamate amidohydrolase
MPSRGRAGHTDTGSVRADVVPGDREGTSCSPALLALVTRHFAAAGLTVRPNEPYKGGFITAHHGRPADDVHAIQIELRRDLYMDEEKFVIVQPGFDRLRGLIAGLIAELRGFNP